MDARIVSLTTLAFFSTMASPAETARIDFRATTSVETIVVEKESPAYAALQDSRFDYSDEETKVTSNYEIKAERLMIGQPFKWNKSQPQTLKLQGLVVSNETKVDHLAQLVSSVSQEIEVETPAAMGEALVKEELARRTESQTPNSGIRRIETKSGQEIVVAKPVYILADKFLPNRGLPQDSAPAPRRSIRAPKGRTAKRENKKGPGQDRTIAQNPSVGGGAAINSMGFDSSKSKPGRHILSGPITFSGGAAYLGNRDVITAQHRIDGMVSANGYVDPKEAFYEVTLDDLAGEIVAEVRSPEGQIMAQGKVNLLNVAKNYENVARIKNIPIELRPTFNGASASIISAASHGKSIYRVANARMFVAGIDREIPENKETNQFEDGAIGIPSNYLVKAQHPRFWPTLGMAQSGESYQARLFPKGLIDALLSLSLPKHEVADAENEALIWGRVTFSGSPVSGARVHVVGDPEKSPVYFTGFLPDKEKTSTGSNGEFAITRLVENEKILRVTLGEKLFWPTMVPVEKKHVSFSDLEIQPPRMVEFRSYEAWKGQPVAAAVQPVGTDEQLLIDDSGVMRMQVDGVKGITLVEADAGEPYLVIRSALRSEQNEIHFPQIEKSWLQTIREKKKLVASEINTAVIGFVEGDNFEVMIGSGSELENKNIIYIDAEGRETQSGVAGGGFVILDMVTGLHTIALVPEKSKRVITQLVYADPYAVHATRINLMY